MIIIYYQFSSHSTSLCYVLFNNVVMAKLNIDFSFTTTKSYDVP